MDVQLWKERIAAYWDEKVVTKLWTLRFNMEEYGARTIQGFVGAMAFIPVFQMAQLGDQQAWTALGTLLGDMGANKLSQLVDSAVPGKIESAKDLSGEVESQLEASPQFREELTRLVEKLNMVSLIRESLSEEDKQVFDEMWTPEKGGQNNVSNSKIVTHISGNTVGGNITSITGSTIHGDVNLWKSNQ